MTAPDDGLDDPSSPATSKSLSSSDMASPTWPTKAAAPHVDLQYGEAGQPLLHWSPPQAKAAATVELDRGADAAALRTPYRSRRAADGSAGISAASTMTDLDGGLFEDSQLGGSLMSAREDTSGRNSFVMEKTERPLEGDKMGLVSGREAARGWDVSGFVSSTSCIERI